MAAIEFIGPIVLALLGARVGRNLAAVAAAAVGVYLLTHVRFAGAPAGVAFAFANAALFTAYIVLAHRVARRSAIGGRRRARCGDAVRVRLRLADRPLGAAHSFADPVALAAGSGSASRRR